MGNKVKRVSQMRQKWEQERQSTDQLGGNETIRGTERW